MRDVIRGQNKPRSNGKTIMHSTLIEIPIRILYINLLDGRFDSVKITNIFIIIFTKKMSRCCVRLPNFVQFVDTKVPTGIHIVYILNIHMYIFFCENLIYVSAMRNTFRTY